MKHQTLGALVLVVLMGCSQPMPKQELWYTTEAHEWMEALPIGNGRLGAMVWSGVETDRLSLGESTMWSGEVNPAQEIPFGRERLDSLRELFFAGKIAEGNHVAWHNLYGKEDSFGSHVPLGDIVLQMQHGEGELSNYKRSLDLLHGVIRIEYQIGDTHYSREYLCSHPDEVMAVHLQTDSKEGLWLEISARLLRPEASIRTEEGVLFIEGKSTQPNRTRGGVLFAGRLQAVPQGGTMQRTDSSLLIRGAKEITLYIDVRTNYQNSAFVQTCQAGVDKGKEKGFENIRDAHCADVAQLMTRAFIDFGHEKEHLPTDQRQHLLKAGEDDPALQALFFQYGRYLTVASSREDSPLPIALQGFFNDNLACNMGWNNDYHLDINTEQNYWLTGIGNLSECDAPLIRYIGDLAKAGAHTVQTIYGCQGWTAHTTANVWGYTAPSGCIAWGLFPTAGSWMATHLWSHFLYTGDKAFLRETGYPLLKGNAQFLLDYMCTDPRNRYLVTGPSISPENSFGHQGERYSACMMPTIDRVLAMEILNDCVAAAEILGIDAAFADSARAAIQQLPPLMINQYGGLREWLENYEDVNPNHRHTSHLLALYPFHQISLEQTPDLAIAAANTLQRRITAEGWEDVEWSRANAICYYARLKEPEKAYESVNGLIGALSRENLFTVSPKGIAGAPWDIFAIDGNMAGAAGIAEMLVQWHEGYVELLPCLPKQWHSGRFKGLCVPGMEIDAEWKNGKLTCASIRCKQDGTYLLKLPNGELQNSTLKKGEQFTIK